jgi:hypothetical protein
MAPAWAQDAGTVTHDAEKATKEMEYREQSIWPSGAIIWNGVVQSFRCYLVASDQANPVRRIRVT